jgi:hypothetical protein
MTAPNPFVVGAVAVVVLAQVPLVAYLSRHVELDADAERPDASKGYVTYGTVDARPSGVEAASDETAGCPACGADVRESYEYCGTCATRIPPAGPTGGERR